MHSCYAHSLCGRTVAAPADFKEDLVIPASSPRQYGFAAAGSRPVSVSFPRSLTAALVALPAHEPMKKDPMK